MRLGIGSYTYGWATGVYGPELTRSRHRMSAMELVDRAAAYGLEVVQIVSLPALDRMSDGELADLHEYGTEHGIEFEVGTTGSDPRTLRSWLRAGQALGARLVRTLLPNASPGLAEERKRLAEVIPEYRDAGVWLAIENHEAYSIRDLLDLLDALHEPVGVCLDTVNSLGRGEGVREVVDALMPRTISLHIKDFRILRGSTDMGFTITGAPAGAGYLDIPWLLAKSRDADPDLCVILEQWTPIQTDLEQAIVEQERWADEGIRYLQTLLRNGLPGLI